MTQYRLLGISGSQRKEPTNRIQPPAFANLLGPQPHDIVAY